MPKAKRWSRPPTVREESEEVDRVLRALANPARRWLLLDLDTHIGLDVSYLKEGCSLTRQALHRHLAILVKAGLVIKGDWGKTRLYYIDPRPMRRVFAELARRYKRSLGPLSSFE